MHLVSDELSIPKVRQNKNLTSCFCTARWLFNSRFLRERDYKKTLGRRLFRRTNYLLNELEKNHYFGIRINLDS